MAELIGVISGVVGIAAFAVDVTRGIIGVIDGMKNAPKNIQQLQQELGDLQAILEELAAPKPELDEKSGNRITEMAVRSCLVELQKLQSLVQPFQSDEKDGLRKRFRMHMQGEGEIREIVEKLQSRKLTLCLALMTTLSGKITSGDIGSHGLQKTAAVKAHEPGLQRANTMKAHEKETTNTWMEIVVQNINQKVAMALSQFIQNPDARIEDLLELDKTQAQDFWRMNLGSVNQLREVVWKQKQEKFLESLYAPDYQQDRLDAKNASASTCEWIWDQPQYLSWRQSTESCALHVYGKPGSGKSVLAKSVLEKFAAAISEDDARKQNCGLLYYFCSNRSRPDEAASSILRALIHQLIRQQSNLIGVILQSTGLIDSHPFLKTNEASTWSLETLWRMFILLVANSQVQTIYCIIDGLDESEKMSVEALLSLLPELLNKRTEGPIFKLFLTSRPEEHIEEGLEDYAFRIRIDSDVIEHDISKFVSERLGKIKKRLRLNAQEESELRANLVTRAEGMFLWAKLAMEEAEKTRGLTTRKLKGLIRTLPSGLNGLYKVILEKIDAECADTEDLRLVQKLLTWIVLATRPLTLSELRICLALEPGMDSLDPDDLMRNLRQDVQVLCGSFVEIIPGKGSVGDTPSTTSLTTDKDTEENEDLSATVRLVHQSAKDYLIDATGSLKGPLSKFRVSAQQGHNEIALLCITYLLFEEFQSRPINIHGLDEEYECNTLVEDIMARFDQSFDDHGFLDYAATHWPFHARQACKTGEAHNVIVLAGDFLSDYPIHFRNWDQVSLWLQLTAALDSSGMHSDLLERVMDNFNPKHSGLNAAAVHGLLDIAKHLLDVKNANPNTLDKRGHTPLINILGGNQQAEVDDIPSIVELLLEKGADVEAKTPHGWTALYFAAQNNYPVAARLLLENGASIEAETEDGWGVLQRASEGGYLDIVRMLLDRGADIEKKASEAGWFPLALAAKGDHVAVVRLLLERGASLDTCTEVGRYPLHVQAEYGNSQEVVNLLLDSGADIDIADYNGSTPLLDALGSEKWDTAMLLLRRGASAGKINALLTAARRGFLEMVQLLLDKGIDIEATDGGGWNALLRAAENGHVDLVKFLLDRGADIEKKACEAGWFPLALAAKGDHLETVKLLLDRGADVNSYTDFGRTSLHVQAEYGNSQEIVKLLLDKGADIDKIDNGGVYTPLLDAITSGKPDTAMFLLHRGADISRADTLKEAALQGFLGITKFLLDKGIDIEATDSGGWSALLRAAENGHVDLVKFLLDRGADIEKKAPEAGWFPLALAAKGDHLETVKLLLERGADVNSYTDFGRTSLHVQAEYGNSQEIVKLLLDKGADIDKVDHGSYTPLLDAISEGKLETTKLLLDRGARIDDTSILSGAIEVGFIEVVQILLDRGVDLKAVDHSDALNTATQKGFQELVQLLLGHGADIKAITNESLHGALHEGHPELTTMLVDRGAGVDHGEYAIFLDAAASGCIDVVQVLLKNGTEIEQTDEDGWNALHFSASRGNLETVTFLLDNGIRINTTDNSGLTALCLATREEKLDVAMLLLDRGADITPVDEDGWHVFHFAIECGYFTLVKRLLEINPDTDLEGKTSDVGWFPLALAAKEGHIELVEFLLDRGVDINNYTDYSRTPLHVAAEYGDKLEMIQLLLDKGANLDAVDDAGYTPFLDATSADRPDVMTLLLNRGADIRVVDENGKNALHIAAENGSSGAAELLLSKGIDIELKTKDGGWTALSLAAKEGHLEFVKILIGSGADIEAKNEDGETASTIAEMMGQEEISHFLSGSRIMYRRFEEMGNNKGVGICT